jgi:UDP-N-acetylmuramate: L-alanyl-gamma-D-glutamyl-meso-diaminopimelate ligase
VKIHFIAVGGTGMGALAILLKEAGHDVRGSDTALYPPMSTQLERAGIPVFVGFGDKNLEWGPDVVVVGNVCSKDHVEVLAAQARGITLESFPSLLEKTLLADRRALVIAGTHGKTTTTSIVAWLLRAAGRDPSWLVGGVPLNLRVAAHHGAGEAFVIEGDEYDTAFFDKKSKFLHYRPRRVILTSVEFDHADIFADLEAVKAAFREFLALIPSDGTLIVNRDDEGAMDVASAAACRAITYRVLASGDGDVRSADYTARVLTKRGSRRHTFEVFEHGESLGVFSSMMLGRYNIGNALAAIALVRAEGVAADELRRGLARFRGVRRRQELIGTAQGVRVFEDFAHHPTAVRVTLAAMRRRYHEGALRVCFEPRSASSRRAVFFDGFAEAFDAATAVYVGPLFAPEKIPVENRLDTHGLAGTIAARGITARAYDDVDALAAAVLEDAAPGDTIVVLSSGAFGGLTRKVLDGLGDPVIFAIEEDRPAIDALVTRYGMPNVRDFDDVESLVIRAPGAAPGGALVGCVNLQLVGDDAYLFGLSVAPERRGEGLGWVLADSVLRLSKMLGAQRVHLLTNDASDFFANRLGFQTCPADDVPDELHRNSNFAAGWRDGVTYMRTDVTAANQRLDDVGRAVGGAPTA